MTKNKHINIVKRRLWCSGYRVSERSREVDGYDLIVRNAKRVRVISAKSPKDIDFGDDMHRFDILAVVTTATFGKPLVGYCTVGNPTPTVTIAEAFGLLTKKKHHGKKTSKKVTPKGSEEVKA